MPELPRPVRVPREREELQAALTNHLALLREYAVKAFEERDARFRGEVAAKLRLLVYESPSPRSRSKPLLLGLADEVGDDLPLRLDGPPVKPPTGPSPGDVISLREYLGMTAFTVRVSSSGELVTLTKAQFIATWAQQSGGSHVVLPRPRGHGISSRGTNPLVVDGALVAEALLDA